MNMFVDAVKEVQIETRTENNMKTYDSSKNHLVDLFFMIGSSRGKNLNAEFSQALAQDETLALRLLMWARDVRGGAGERQIVRDILCHLEKYDSILLERLIPFIPEYGRWDDLLIFNTRAVRDIAFGLIAETLLEGKHAQVSLSQFDEMSDAEVAKEIALYTVDKTVANDRAKTKQFLYQKLQKAGLCAKWMDRKGLVALNLRNFMKLTPRSYRKLLVGLTNVVEQKMCANQWTDINYSHVPSVAASRYQVAFTRHDPEGYGDYKAKLLTGEAKVNASAVYPYDVIKSYFHGGDDVVVKAQWEALPNYVGDQLILPMVDVSGSMESPVGGNANLSCMDVAISLGLYLADKNTGPFKDMFLTFSESPKFSTLKGDLIKKISQLRRADWGMNTDLHKAFNMVLDYAVKGNVKEEDMPQYLLILSDMEFDQCAQHDDSAMQMIERKYQSAGYTIPKIVFWNLNARSKNVPVKYNKQGVALVSGFSPAIMTSILGAENFDPESIMLETLNSPRYSMIE